MKHGDDDFHCSLDPTAPMKRRSLRLPFTLILLAAAAATILSCRSAAVRRRLDDSSPAAAAFSIPATPNATLLRLASIDVGEEYALRDIGELLDGTFFTGDSRYRSISSWRRQNHHHHHYHPHFPFDERPRSSGSRSIPIRLLRYPKDYSVLPEFRRALRDWSRNRRRFHSGVMSELITLVKIPIDGHNGVSDDRRRRRYGSCAVVGNSGILLKNDHGDMIDGHDLVIRLNNARIEGYHRNVGSKTGLAFVNSNILHLCARRETCFCHPYGEDVPMIMYICQPVHFLDYVVCNSSHKPPLLVTDARLDLLCARVVRYYSMQEFTKKTGKPPAEWDKVHDAKMFHYSSGMQAVMLALGICEQVSIYGFGKSAEAKHHYHTNQKVELSLHDYEAEYAFYHDLMERPQVIPFLMEESGFKVPPVVMYQ